MNYRKLWIIHPGLIFGVTWTIALFFWGIASENVIYNFFPSGRVKYIGPYLYLSLFIIGFLLFCFNAIKRGFKRSILQGGFLHLAYSDKTFAALFCKRASFASMSLILCANLALLIHIFTIFKSGGFIDYDFSDVYTFRKAVFSGSIQSVTILKFVALPGFILATIQFSICKKWKFLRSKRKAALLRALSCMTPLMSVMMGTRSMVLLWIIPYLYLVAAIKILLLRKKIMSFRIGAYYFLIGLIFIGSLFIIGEYQRRYSRIASGFISAKPYVGIEKPTFTEYSLYAIQSYFFRTTNNGLSIVAFLKNHTVLWSTFRWFYTGFGIERLDPGGLIRNVKMDLWRIQLSGYGFFTSSNSGMPGVLFIDWGWFALAVSAIGGHLVGVLFTRLLSGDITSFIVLPIIIFGLVETWQSGILFKSPVMVPILSGIVLCWYLKKKLPLQ